MISPIPTGQALLALAPAAPAAQIPALGASLVLGLAGLLQLGVAIYAIRLNRLFGTARVGWSLFWAFLLLALLHFVQSVTPSAVAGFKLNLEFVYVLVSLLLLVGMVHLHAVLKEEARRTRAEERLRDELELEVRRKTANLNGMIQVLQSEIEERNRAEAQVREQARLLDLAHNAIVVQDLTGKILYWNKGAENIFGWTADEALGSSHAELLAWDQRVCATARQAVREQGHWEGGISARTKRGQRVLLDEDWTLVRDAGGVPKSIMMISADITEKRKLEEQALRLQRLESIGTLAGGIAHDLNNVLTPLLMSVQLLKENIRTPEDRELLDTLQGNVMRGARLVKQILTFGRGVKGERAVVQPAQLVGELKQLVLDTFPKSVACAIELADDLWTVTGDATQLHQVMLNLCVNARDAMPAGGRLLIRVTNAMLGEAEAAEILEAQPGPFVVLEVADNGTGIPKEIQAQIFEPFFTTKEHGKGTGLGLSTCFSIVKNHGGFIQCLSEPGQGSVFKVFLPANQHLAAAEPRAAESECRPQGHDECVLIVDDEQLIREFAQMTLQCFGYRTLTAANGAEAVRLYQDRPEEIAVVLMDMGMPVMDGPTAIAALRTIAPGVLILGSSGLACADYAQPEARLAGFLPKPYTADALLLALDHVLHSRPAVPENPVMVEVASAAV
jgi:PAS domain S-box-containing protein